LDEGECSGCYTHREKDLLDWSDRRVIFEELVRHCCDSRKRQYDCVVPVQGDAEDYFVITKVLEFGLNPLVVHVNDYFQNEIGWHNFHNLITYFDLDSVVYNPELFTYKEMVRTCLRKFNHILWPSIALRTAFPVHIAKQRKIPLIIWGQNQPTEQVGKFSHLDAVEMSKWSRWEHDLFGCDLDKVVGSGAQVKIGNLNYYQYPEIKGLGHSKVRGVYLSNYLRWDPLLQNSQSVDQGFIPQRNIASFDIYERAGSSVYYKFHDLLKMERVGYRKVRDQLSREIRHGRVDRNSAVELEAHYNATKVDVTGIFEFLGVTKSGLEWFVSKRLSKVGSLIGIDQSGEVDLPGSIKGLLHGGEDAANEYILFGKGVSL